MNRWASVVVPTLMQGTGLHRRVASGFNVVLPLIFLVACSSTDGGTPSPTATGGSGGTASATGGSTTVGGQSGTSGSTGGSGGSGGAAFDASTGTGGGTVNDDAASNDATISEAATDVAPQVTADAGPDVAVSGDSGLTDPGTEGDGRFPMMRPAVPAEASGRLPGVMAGTMRGFQVPAAMGFAGRGGQVYTPVGYVANTPVAFMIFHDGTSLAGSENIPIVIDNLIFEKKIPMMVAIFIPPVDRSREYDTVNVNFSQYLTTNALPAVEALNIKLTTDPEASGASGHSSGGILAFTMAWFQPERYRRVLSFSGSFTSLQNPGGDLYNNLIRTTMPLKPIRMAMTAGTNDLLAPRWTQANETMGGALGAAGYHYRYILISGGTHDQASSLPWVADLMTWLWRGYPITGPTH